MLKNYLILTLPAIPGAGNGPPVAAQMQRLISAFSIHPNRPKNLIRNTNTFENGYLSLEPQTIPGPWLSMYLQEKGA